MKWKTCRPYAVSIVLVLALSGATGWVTFGAMDAYEAAAKSPLAPPPSAFPVIWTALSLLTGVGAAMVWRTGSPGRSRALKVCAAQLLAGFIGSILFFNLQMYGFAFFWLLLSLALTAAMTGLFRRVSPAAAGLQIPGLIWTVFAAYLAYGVWARN